MKSVLLVFGLLMIFSLSSFAQLPLPAMSPAPIVAASPVPAVQAQSVVVAEPAAPPQWAQDVLVNAQKLPVVGPYVAKAILYAGIIAGLLTALVAFLLSVLSLISSVASVSGLSGFAQKLQDFKDGKVMYWLKYLSMFNAQKPQPADALGESVSKAV